MLGATDWGKVLTDLATLGTQTAVTLKSKPWKTGVQPTPQAPVVIEDSSGSSMKVIVGVVAVVGVGILAYSLLKKKRA